MSTSMMATTRSRSKKQPDATLRVEMVDVDGTMLRTAVRHGSGNGPPLVMLNGIGAKLEALKGFVDALNPEIGVILFDIPGVGGSPKAGRSLRMPDMAHLLAALLRKLGHERADVFGVSWGGALAQEFAHSCPQECRRLILGATATGMMMIPGNPMSMMTMMNPMRFMQKDFVARNAAAMYGGRLRKDPSALQKISEHMMGGGGGFGPMMSQGMALMGWSSMPFLHKLQQPTLVIAGKDDPIVPPVNGRLIARRIPNARFVLVDCGHLFILTLTDEVAALVDEFLH
jgi:poly(3-hydroxyalkanoate) depolymerase